MAFYSTLFQKIREAIGRMIPYKSIEQAEHIETPLTTDMVNAVDKWYRMYIDRAPWVEDDRKNVKSLNLPSFIASEMARQILIEMKWSITGKGKDGETKDEKTGEELMNPRAEYLKKQFEGLMNSAHLRAKLEQGCAAGGMIIKPYPKLDDGSLHFDWAMDWGFYPIAFDDDGNLTDFIVPDVFREGKTIYTRLERHRVIDGKEVSKRRKAAVDAEKPETGKDSGAQPGTPSRGREQPKKGILITQRAFKSTFEDSLGREIELDDVPRWEGLQKEAVVTGTNQPLIGWFRVAAANTVDVDSPLGASIYAKSVETIREADLQYSRILWEYEGSELAIDVDPSALRPRKVAGGGVEMPKLKDRLFRAVDIDKGDRDLYEVFSPQIRDSALFNGLNQLLMRIEDQCGLSRGTISDVQAQARTATELKILRERTYATVDDNQKALERCLRDVIKAMDRYATIYKLAPEGEYDVSFEWDDSILTDMEQQTQERLMLMNAGIMGKSEFRQWYFGETKAQADAAIEAITKEKTDAMMEMQELMPSIKDGMGDGSDGNPQKTAQNQPDGKGKPQAGAKNPVNAP